MERINAFKYEGWEPLDVKGAVDIIMKHVEENLETPEEMTASWARRAHRRPWDDPMEMSRGR